MTIECYKSSCLKHSNHYGLEGPFCDESICIESPYFGGEYRNYCSVCNELYKFTPEGELIPHKCSGEDEEENRIRTIYE